MLQEAVDASDSVLGVLRHLNVPAAGGTHALVSRRIRDYGIDTAHFERHAQGGRRHRLDPESILTPLPTGSARRKVHLLIRALVERGRSHTCQGCGLPPFWHGQVLTLHVDHVNGDFLDNRMENLRFLCPNCHSQTPNHSGRSKGKNSGPGLSPAG